jgi:hypothetical protein
VDDLTFSEREERLQQQLDDECLWEQFNSNQVEVDGMWPAIIKDERKQSPAGYVLFSIDSVSREYKGQPGSEKAVESVKMTIVAPEAYEGTAHEEVFWLGSDQDPKAERAETLERGGASKFKAFAATVGVNIEGQDEDLVRSQLKDLKIMGYVQHKVNTAGFVNARISTWMAEGEKEPSVDEEAMKAARAQADAIQTNGGAQRGQGTLPPRFTGPATRPGAPLPPARPSAAPTAAPRINR